MLVSVTGGTEFVGARSIAAILGTGHRVRLLVRLHGAGLVSDRQAGRAVARVELVGGR